MTLVKRNEIARGRARPNRLLAIVASRCNPVASAGNLRRVIRAVTKKKEKTEGGIGPDKRARLSDDGAFSAAYRLEILGYAFAILYRCWVSA